jgi:hypothetical protein
MNDEDIERAAQFFLKENPAFRSRFYEKYLEVCEETGVEPDDEVFEDLVLRAATEMVGNDQSLMSELFTKEEVERLTREEAERLRDPETHHISGEDLANAVAARMNEQLSRHFPRRHPPKD